MRWCSPSGYRDRPDVVGGQEPRAGAELRRARRPLNDGVVAAAPEPCRHSEQRLHRAVLDEVAAEKQQRADTEEREQHRQRRTGTKSGIGIAILPRVLAGGQYTVPRIFPIAVKFQQRIFVPLQRHHTQLELRVGDDDVECAPFLAIHVLEHAIEVGGDDRSVAQARQEWQHARERLAREDSVAEVASDQILEPPRCQCRFEVFSRLLGTRLP